MIRLRVKEKVQHFFRRIGRAKTVGVRAVIFNTQEEVLLVKHTYRPGWHTPGGAVESGESPIDAICREIYEETGLEVTTEPQIFAVYRHRWRDLDDYPILYVVKDQESTPVTNDKIEISDVKWFPLCALPEDITNKTRERIDEVLGNRKTAKVW
ncbi:NUDIX domain-containing protein [Rickettsiella endosymbiont of Dermanyssus gallinae]|uniref:NUDIX domain-containing protein n=1 Tax=Rickettsiella endosymbiont of Dermanyssus gallinae TaxID=2856608 RepID=UPI001FEAC02A|nr:NUDIX domain-containing protein [Rickettsiella endosymbiont of Dermanyssus gallinae]